MIEVAVAYLGAYAGRKALGLLTRAGTDADDAIDAKLGQMYEWVKGKLTRRPGGDASLRLLESDPDGKDQKELVAEQLSAVVDDDDVAKSELEAIVAELDRLRPAGITIEGLARGDDVRGKQIGVDWEGEVPEGAEIKGTAVAKTVHEGAENVGVRKTR